MNDYIKKIRQHLGHQKFIHPAARILIEDKKGEFLFIKRIDNGQLGIPAGGLEEGETIEECIKREVLEETGIELLEMKVIGIASNPIQETVTYPNGDLIQYFTIEFYSNQWKGNLRADHIETSEVSFLDKKYIIQLPTNEKSTYESLVFFREKGKVRIS